MTDKRKEAGKFLPEKFKKSVIYATGWKSGGDRGSNWRRIFSRFCILAINVLFVEAYFNAERALGGVFFSGGLILIALYFFLDVVVLVPFRSSGGNPPRK